MDARSLALCRLQDCPGLGAAGLGAVLKRFPAGLPDELYGRSADCYEREYGLPRAASTALAAYSPRVNGACEALPVRMITQSEVDYPAALRRMECPPPLLAEHGIALKRLPKGKFTVLCSAGWEGNHPEAVKGAIEAGLEAGWCAVTGHNRPVYQWAALAAKRKACHCIIALDRGMVSAFGLELGRDPIAAARIWGYAFDIERSLAVSPFRLRDGWAPDNGRYRDAMIAALADTIIVMGMRPGGTIHRVCARALSQGQRVLAEGEAYDVLVEAGAIRWEGVFPEGQVGFGDGTGRV